MKINLSKTHYIKDGYGSSVVLCETKLFKNQKTEELMETESIISYHSTVEQATTAYIRRASVQETSNNATLREYVENVKNLVQSVKDMFEKTG